MIGDGWDGDPAIRPGEIEDAALDRPRRVAVVTGSRADYGLLRPVMRAIAGHPSLELLTIAAGSHLVLPGLTFRDVKADFEIFDSIPMQAAGRTGRAADVEAIGAGVSRFGRSFERIAPDWVVVLGDRIEAFAAATAGAIGGRALCHIHGGDRAEGVSDESMRHAITKLAHLHCAATERSAERIRRMGERAEMVRVTGSPAIDELGAIEPLDDRVYEELGSPDTVVLFHPIGRHAEEEESAACAILEAVRGRRVVALAPNLDPGRQGIVRALQLSEVRSIEHLPRSRFVGLLKRVAGAGGVLVGNSSAGLIEASALGVRVVDVGDRQAGRETPAGVVHVAREHADAIGSGIRRALAAEIGSAGHPYGDGRAGARIAEALAGIDPLDTGLLRKRCVY